MQLTTIRRLLIDELQEIYISESLIKEEFPRLVRGADSPDLKKAFEKHGDEANGQIARLEKVFEKLETSPRGGHGRSVKALLTETEDRMGEGGDPHVVDASLIAAAKRLVHWKIATYGVMATYAHAMNLPEIAGLLTETLNQEIGMDEKLSQIAREVNVESPDSPQAKKPKE